VDSVIFHHVGETKALLKAVATAPVSVEGIEKKSQTMSKDPESCKNCKPRTTWFAQGNLVDLLWDLRLSTQKDIDVRVKQNTKYYRHLNARNFQRSKILSPPFLAMLHHPIYCLNHPELQGESTTPPCDPNEQP